jgi:hypothetical protein
MERITWPTATGWRTARRGTRLWWGGTRVGHVSCADHRCCHFGSRSNRPRACNVAKRRRDTWGLRHPGTHPRRPLTPCLRPPAPQRARGRLCLLLWASRSGGIDGRTGGQRTDGCAWHLPERGRHDDDAQWHGHGSGPFNPPAAAQQAAAASLVSETEQDTARYDSVDVTEADGYRPTSTRLLP